MGNYINSFSAFGEKRQSYMTLFPLIIRMHYALYPDSKWKISLITDRPFTSDDYYGNTVNKLSEAGLLQFRVINNGGSIWEQPIKGVGMLWRLLPAWDSENEYVFCRDLDSILTPRQAKYVQRFINSGCVIHGINDNNSHTIPLMGGMIGVRCKSFVNAINFPSFSSMISSWHVTRDFWDNHGKDQVFLMDHIWPKVQHMAHIDRIGGPNDRCMMKDCVPGLSLSNIHTKILEEGDNLTNYIGAANCKNTTYGEKTLQEMIDFYEEYGNKETNKQINILEKI